MRQSHIPFNRLLRISSRAGVNSNRCVLVGVRVYVFTRCVPALLDTIFSTYSAAAHIQSQQECLPPRYNSDQNPPHTCTQHVQKCIKPR